MSNNLQKRKWYSGMLSTEDWWSVWMAFFFITLGLFSLAKVDLVGWVAIPSKWVYSNTVEAEKKNKNVSINQAIKPIVGKAYKKTKKSTFVITQNSLDLLKNTSINSDVLRKIEIILNKDYLNRKEFREDLQTILTNEELALYRAEIFKAAEKSSKKADKILFSETWGNLGWWNVLITYLFLTLATSLGAFFMKWNLRKFIPAWTIIFFLTYIIWIIGNHALFASDQTNRVLYGLTSSLSLGGGGAFILALIVGLIIGNFFKGFADFLSVASKPEWFIKTAIVFLGVKVGFMAIEASGFVFDLAIAGAAATIVAYLIFWPGTYLMARRLFKLPMKTSAVLSSAISICGVSAAVATAGAVRAKPLIPVMVSALIVVYAVIELVIIPPLFTATMIEEPIVAGAAMGMAIKTDGADAAAGAIMDEMMRARKLEMDGTVWKKDYIMQSAIMTKIWIDMFIGIWAFVLALIWVKKIDNIKGEKVLPSEIWHRFPKFVIAYFISWFAYLAILMVFPDLSIDSIIGAIPVEGGLRKLFFMMTFLTIGINTNFKKLAEARFGKMIFVYFVALFIFILPVALAVAWLFHHGMEVPVEF